MTYVIAGLHGSLEKYESLKKSAGIKDTDTVYVIGGIAEGDLSLLDELSMCANVYPVMAKPDLTALKMLGGFDRMLRDGSSPTPEFIAEMQAWMTEGGQSVLEAFRELDADAREGVLDYLGDFTCFEEAELGGKSYLLLSSGIADFDKDADLYELEPSAFIDCPLVLENTYYTNKTIITADAGIDCSAVVRANNNVCIGCRSAVALRLDDLSEFYA